MSPACRFCAAPLDHTFVDLGAQPPANSYLDADGLDRPETFYPLHVRVCARCLLVQLPEVLSPQALFSEYAYFSSYSESWLRHAERYAEAMIRRFGLGSGSQVVEVASNDGYLLRYFRRRQVPVLGIEPAANVAAAALAEGIPTRVEFFGRACAERLVAEGVRADLLIGNNVFAHVPDVNDFVAGLAMLLAPRGTVSLEFPHLQPLLEAIEFDTIYHEHFSYFSFGTARRILESQGLTVFDVEELPTHGGSLRVHARHAGNEALAVSERVGELLDREHAAGLDRLETLVEFAVSVRRVKRDLLKFLIEAQEQGRTVVGYGAPAKGNTLLNFCGIGPELLPFTVDRSPHKQGRFLPGSRIPIRAPQDLLRARPEYVLVLPWNLLEEIMGQMAEIASWGGRFVVAVPRLRVLASALREPSA